MIDGRKKNVSTEKLDGKTKGEPTTQAKKSGAML